MGLTPDSEIRFLRGVGEQRMKKYQRLGITTVEDLLRHAPRDYLDLRRPCPIRVGAGDVVGVPCGANGCCARASPSKRFPPLTGRTPLL